MWTTEARQRYAWTRRQEGLRLTNKEWALFEPLLPKSGSTGRPWKHPLRVVLDAILHLLVSVLEHVESSELVVIR
jgi:hypothetical protein